MSSAWNGLRNDAEMTELPHYAINESLPEDSFFTDRAVARYCYDRFCAVCAEHGLDLSEYRFIEPSAGEGCFYDLLPDDSLAMDIVPRHADIHQKDFLFWYPDDKKIKGDKAKYAVIGNPPFGVRGALALAFVNRAFLFADVVGFILPMSFYSNGKGSNMKRVEGASLLHSTQLPKDAFYTPETHETVSVKTLFQVWQKGKSTASVFTDYDVSAYVDIFTCCSAPSRYCGLGRGRNYDCFIASTFYKDGLKIVYDFGDVLYGSGYGIIVKKDKRRIMQILRRADWTQYCSDATNSCRHIRMYHIRKLLGEHGIGVLKSK